MREHALLAGALLDQPNTFRRLVDELIEAAHEFRQDPIRYLTSITSAARGGDYRRARLRLGLAIAVLVYALFFAAMLVLWTVSRHPSGTIAVHPPRISWWIPPYSPPRVNALTNTNDDREAHGGGGGGRDNQQLPSVGEIPAASLTPPVIAPVPEPPVNQATLPVMETVLLDPQMQPRRDELAPTGLRDGVVGPPSSGPGSGRGMGGGQDGGMGPGKGPGVGPGEGGNCCGGNNQIGNPRWARSAQPAVDSRPVLLNNPRPLYTEEARKNKIQGSVRVRLLVGADGTVKEVAVVSGLSDGLTEQAIKAAYQMRFTPAMKNGRALAYWLGNVVVEFNLR